MAQKKKKTGTKQVPKKRYNSDTGGYDTVYVTEDVFSWVDDSSSNSGSTDTSSYGGSDTSSYDSGSY